VTRHPHGPSLPGQLGAVLVVLCVLGVWACALREIWSGQPHPLSSIVETVLR
jgi:hypothetical protein